MKKHYFIALELPRYVKESLAQWARETKSRYPFKKWVHQQDYHITLAFLGDVNEENACRAMDRFSNQPGTHRAIECSITGLNIFGNSELPRILWAEMEENRHLAAVQQVVFTACLEEGFLLDSKPFIPHITMARQSMQRIKMTELQEWGRKLPEIGECLLETIVLYRTNIGEIPKYEPIKRVQL